MKNVGNEYGTALFMLAAEEGKIKEYGDALTKVADAFREEGAYFSFLQNPAISLQERVASIKTVFGAILPESVLSFLLLLSEKGRMSSFFDAFDTYMKLLLEAKRVSNVKITSAVALTDEEKEKLENKLKTASGRKILASYAVDPALLGGLIIEMDDKIIDGSLRHRLSEIKGVINNE